MPSDKEVIDNEPSKRQRRAEVYGGVKRNLLDHLGGIDEYLLEMGFLVDGVEVKKLREQRNFLP